MRFARAGVIALCSTVVGFAGLAGSGCTGWLEPPPESAGNGTPHPAPSEERHSGGSDDSSAENLDCSGPTPPGETPFRRLTSAEFNNAVGDLVPNVSLSHFEIPGDEQAGAFRVNTSSGVGTHISKRYRDASESVSEKVVSNLSAATGCGGSQDPEVFRKEAESIGSDSGQASGDFWALYSDGDLTATIELPAQGDYRISAVAAGTNAGGEAPNMEFRVDGAPVGSASVSASKSSPEAYETQTTVSGGSHEIGVAFTNDYYDDSTGNDRNLFVDRLTVSRVGASVDGAESCLRSWLKDFAGRAWRRPLTDTEKSRLESLFDSGTSEYDARVGLRMGIEAVLQSPKFLYRYEGGEEGAAEGGAVPLDDFELATRLSFFLWDTIPDEKLLEAARNGELSTADQLEEQARRMIQSPKARDALNRAVLSMLGLRNFESDEEHAGDLDPEMRAAMKKETLAFIDHVLWEDDGRLETLMTARYSFPTNKTSELYEGVEAGSDGGGVGRVEFDESDPRVGVLTQPAVLARYGAGAKTIHRGLFVLENLLCAPPAPPPDELQDPPERKEGESARSQAQDRMEHDQCGACHGRIDPIGLTFDRYGRMGRFREQDPHGNDLKSSGAIAGFEGISGDVSGPKQLAERLADSERLKSCVSEQWMTRALGRQPSGPASCSVQSLEKALDESGGDLREMFVQIVLTDAFRYKSAPEQ